MLGAALCVKEPERQLLIGYRRLRGNWEAAGCERSGSRNHGNAAIYARPEGHRLSALPAKEESHPRFP